MPGSFCPNCEMLLARDALRCRWCGADARGAEDAPDGVSAGFSLEDLLTPDQARAVDVIDRLEEIAPDHMKWRKDGQSGPAPTLPAEHRREAIRLLTELAELRERMFGSDQG